MKRVLIWLLAVLATIAATWFLLAFLPQSPFRDDFIPNFSATLLGVVLGIPVALSLNASQAREEQVKQAQRAREVRNKRARQLIKMLQFSLTTSDAFLQSVGKNLAPGRVIYANLDLEQLEATSSLKYELIEDLAVSGHLDVARYDLLFIRRLMDLHLQISFGPLRVSQDEAAVRSEQAAVVERILDHIPRTREAMAEAQKRMTAYLATLSSEDKSSPKQDTVPTDAT